MSRMRTNGKIVDNTFLNMVNTSYNFIIKVELIIKLYSFLDIVSICIM